MHKLLYISNIWTGCNSSKYDTLPQSLVLINMSFYFHYILNLQFLARFGMDSCRTALSPQLLLGRQQHHTCCSGWLPCWFPSLGGWQPWLSAAANLRDYVLGDGDVGEDWPLRWGLWSGRICCLRDSWDRSVCTSICRAWHSITKPYWNQLRLKHLTSNCKFFLCVGIWSTLPVYPWWFFKA